MGNSTSKKRKDWIATKQYSNDVEPTQRTRSLSPFRRAKSAVPAETSELCDVPGKPGKAVVTLTNLQSEKPSGSCVTDSIFLDWKPPVNDGGRPIQGYSVEMYDLPTGNWVTVTQTEGPTCRSMLDNILCGIMYRFRVRAFNEVGTSIPGIPSDAFVIDTPGVHIAPYFILCPPPEVSKYAHDTVQFRAKALGTPTPNILWQKDAEPIFITQGIDIEDEPDGSLLTVHNLQLDDTGVIECVAVNHVGKAIASTNLNVIAQPKFQTLNIPLQFSFRNDDMIRLKFPLESQPDPLLTLLKDEVVVDSEHCHAVFRENNVLVKIDSSKESDSGSYRIEADNGFGRASLEFSISVEVPPISPTVPEILDVAPTGELTLAWQPPENSAVDHYIVEYYRDQWQLWLRMKTCLDTVTVITDLIPGSKYKFRVMAASISGISEPSPESEEIMIGKPAEDELFDLPARGRHMMKKNRKIPSFDRSSLDRSLGRTGTGLDAVSRRHTSLDREVYYDSNNVRRDVVTYKKPETDRFGELAGKYKLSNDELAKYRTSMSELCHKMKTISSSSVASKGSRISLDTATKPLQMEITNQARKSNSMGQLWSVPHIDPSTTEKLSHHSSSFSSTLLYNRSRASESPLVDKKRTEVSNDIGDCKKSLTDIRERIGSLQSLLKTSRNLTSSKPRLMEDMPKFNVPDLDNRKPQMIESARKTSLLRNRNDSYANAIDDPVVEPCKETHFPYNPELVSLGSLECDKFPQGKPGSNQYTMEGELGKFNGKSQEMITEDDSVIINATVSNFLKQSAEKGEMKGHEHAGTNHQNNHDHENQQNSQDIIEKMEEDVAEGDSHKESVALDDRSISSCSERTMLASPTSEMYMLDTSESTHTLQVDMSDSTQTLQVDRSTSSCSQGTLLADSTSMESDSDELL